MDYSYEKVFQSNDPKSENDYQHALKTGNIDFIKVYIAANNPINSLLKNGESPISYAMTYRQFDVANFLVDNGADVNLHSNGGFSPLMNAIAMGGRKLAKKIISFNADVNQKSGGGISPLSIAALCGDLEMVEHLVGKGARINDWDLQGRSPVIFAALKDKRDIIDFLLNNGGDLFKKDNKGYCADDYLNLNMEYINLYPPQNSIEENGHLPKNLKMKKIKPNVNDILIDLIKRSYSRKDNIDKVDNLGLTDNNAKAANITKIAIQLAKPDIDINYKSRDSFFHLNNSTALMYAAWIGNIYIVKMLIDKGANVNYISKSGKSALTIAAMLGHEDVKKELIKNGANLNQLNKLRLDMRKFIIGVKYSPLEIMQSNTFMYHNKNSSYQIDRLYQSLQNTKNEHIALIFSCAALCALDDEENKPLEYRFSRENGIADMTLNPMRKFTRGCFDPNKNLIFVSNIENTLEALHTMVHESMHKIRFMLPSKNFESLLNASVESTTTYLENIKNFKYDDDMDLYRYNMIERMARGGVYTKLFRYLEEHIADYGKIVIHQEFKNANGFETNEDVIKLIKPLEDFFEKEMIPQMQRFIVQHPKKENIQLPELVEKGLKCLNIIKKDVR